MTLQINTSTGARDLTPDEQAEARAGLAAAAAADLSAHATSTSNPHAVTKVQVGLGSVDNTADLAKPVSAAQASAIAAAVTAHEQAADPHPAYLTQAEAGALYSPTGAYIKPTDGIPRQDLDHTIRGQLDLADTALQPGAQLTQAVVDSTTSAGATLMTGADAAAQRTALGLGTAATTASTAYATAAQGAKADAALPATADAIADVLEAAVTGAPADLERIRSSVSGANGAEKFRQSLDANQAVIGAVGNSIVAWNSLRSFVPVMIGGLAGAASAGVNLAVAGANSEAMLSQVAGIPVGVTAVTFMEGTNAAAAAFPVSRHIAAMRAVGRAIEAKGAAPVLIACPPRETTIQTVLAYYTAEYALAQAEGWMWVDPWQRYVDSDGTWVAGASADGDHPLVPTHDGAGADAAVDIISRQTGRFLCRANEGHGLGSNALMLTDSNADGIPDGFGRFGYTPGSSVLGPATYPARGKQMSLTLSQSVDLELYKSISVDAVASGATVLVSGVISISAITNARVIVWAVFNSPTAGEVSSRVTAYVGSAAHGQRYVQLRIVRPSGYATLNLQVWVTIQTQGGAFTTNMTLANLQAFDLSAATF